jgi:hypothetical protein
MRRQVDRDEVRLVVMVQREKPVVIDNGERHQSDTLTSTDTALLFQSTRMI